MADRTIRTVLTLDPSQYESGMQRAAKASQGLGDTNQKTAQQSRSAMQRLAQSARDNRQAWTEVGGALAVAGGAVTGMMALVAKTGIEYNSLRQVATQSLIGVTGSIEGATEQMRRLDEYGQNSWLMRDTLVRAQQNMTGFGIETNKVVPYMEALAEAVAFAGGNNQTFEELAQVMGVIQSQGKITARELERFAVRGVDAAQLIGDAMGMTASQIREQITAGALDAETALDALTQGMMMNFEGSSDLVRQTFRGATDDVKAAFRDLAAIAMAPLVDPEGGGFLTDLLNQTSDFLFMLRDQLPPEVVQAGGAIAGLGGFATVAAGGLMMLTPQLVSVWDNLERLGRFGSAAQTSLRWIGRNAVPIAAGVTIAASAFKIWADRTAAAEARTKLLAETLDEAGQVTTRTTDEMNQAWTETVERFGVFNMDSVFDEAERMGIAFEDLTGYVLGNADAIDRVNAAGEEYISGSSLWEHFGLVRQNSVQNLTYQLDEWADSLTEAERRELQLAEASEASAEATDGTAVAVGEYAGALEEVAAAQVEARDRLDEWIDSMGQAAASFGGIIDGYNAAAEAADSGTASMEDWIGEMQKQAEAVANWRENTLTASAQIREDLPADMQEAGRAMVNEMVLAGEDGAQALQTFVDGTPEQRRQLIEAWSGTGYDVGVMFANELTSAPDGEIGANIFPAEQALAALIGAVANSEESVIVDGNPVPAENVLEALRRAIVHTEEDVTIAGNEVPAREALDAVITAIGNGAEEVEIGGNRVPADRAVGELLSWIGNQDASVTVSANTSAADRAVNNFMMRHNGRTLTTYQQMRVLGSGMAATGGYMGDFASAMGLAGGGTPKRLIGGGGIFGLGSGTSDSIPIWASKGEFMQQKAAVDKYGTDFMRAVNGLRFPVELARGLRGGGQVEARQYPAQYMPAPRPTPAPAPVSLDGAHITGTFRLEEDGFVRIVDGRIEQQGRVARRGMRAGVGG